jgi:hypothetical protein
MRVALQQRGAKDRLFWRNHSDGEGGRAKADPFTHAVHIPGLQPAIGADLVELLPSLREKEWMLHELSHLSRGEMHLLTFLKRLVHAAHFALYSLNPDTILHIPSRTIDGNSEVSRIFPKVSFLLEDLEFETGLVDEVLCTTQTLVTQLGFAAIHQITFEAFRVAKNSIRTTLEREAEVDPATAILWPFCDRLFNEFITRGAGRATIMDVFLLLIEIDTFVFTPPVAQLVEWWRAGSVPPEQAPMARLTTALHCLEAAPGDLDQATRAVAQLRAADEATTDEWRPPDPFAETVTAFGWTPETVPFVHPVGRAISYLDTGYAPASRDEHLSTRYRRAQSIIVPLVEEQPFPGWFRCRFEARVPMDTPVGELWATSERGSERLTVMPLSNEAGLLWNLQAVFRDLLFDRYIKCHCVHGQSTGTDCHRDLFGRIYDYVRNDDGGYLPPLSCRFSS